MKAGDSPTLRTLALKRSPLAFKRQNIFTSAVDLPLSLRAGRRRKSAEEKRKTNAEHQRRFTKAQLEELAAVRKLARQQGKRNQAIGGVDRRSSGCRFNFRQSKLGEVGFTAERSTAGVACLVAF